MGDGLMSLISQPLDAANAPASSVIAACLLAPSPASPSAMTLALFMGRVQALGRLRIPIVARPMSRSPGPKIRSARAPEPMSSRKKTKKKKTGHSTN